MDTQTNRQTDWQIMRNRWTDTDRLADTDTKTHTNTDRKKLERKLDTYDE